MKSFQYEDRFSAYVGARVVRSSREEAVVMQSPSPSLENHVKVRHASALFTSGFASSRALVLTILDQFVNSTELRLVESNTAYKQVGLGPITATAKVINIDYDLFLANIQAGIETQLKTASVLTNEEGKTVATVEIIWEAGPIHTSLAN